MFFILRPSLIILQNYHPSGRPWPAPVKKVLQELPLRVRPHNSPKGRRKQPLYRRPCLHPLQNQKQKVSRRCRGLLIGRPLTYLS